MRRRARMMAGGLTVAAPSGLAAVAASSTQIDLTWNDNSSNEDAFLVERSTDQASWSQIASKSAGSTSHSDTGLAASTTYYYRVRARAGGGAGHSSYSATANATTSAAPLSFVQVVASGTTYLGSGESTFNITAAAVAVGRKVIVVVAGVGNDAISVTDARGNTYTQSVIEIDGATWKTAIFHCEVGTAIQAGDAITINLTTPSAGLAGACACEYSGIQDASPGDGTNSGHHDGGTAPATGNVTTTVADDLLVVGIAWGGTLIAPPTYTPPAGWNSRYAGSAAFTETLYIHFYDKIVAATGTYGHTGTIAPDPYEWSAVIAAYKGG